MKSKDWVGVFLEHAAETTVDGPTLDAVVVTLHKLQKQNPPITEPFTIYPPGTTLPKEVARHLAPKTCCKEIVPYTFDQLRELRADLQKAKAPKVVIELVQLISGFSVSRKRLIKQLGSK